MRTRKPSKVSALCFTFLLSLSAYACAQGNAHEQKDVGSSNGGMMHKSMSGKMGTKHMTRMMGECMAEHSDQPACDMKVLKNCEESKSAQECATMMKEAKK